MVRLKAPHVHLQPDCLCNCRPAHVFSIWRLHDAVVDFNMNPFLWCLWKKIKGSVSGSSAFQEMKLFHSSRRTHQGQSLTCKATLQGSTGVPKHHLTPTKSRLVGWHVSISVKNTCFFYNIMKGLSGGRQDEGILEPSEEDFMMWDKPPWEIRAGGSVVWWTTNTWQTHKVSHWGLMGTTWNGMTGARSHVPQQHSYLTRSWVLATSCSLLSLCIPENPWSSEIQFHVDIFLHLPLVLPFFSQSL